MKGFDLASARRSIWEADAPTMAKVVAWYVLDRWQEVDDPWVAIPASEMEAHLSISRNSRQRHLAKAEEAGLLHRRGGGVGAPQYSPNPWTIRALGPQSGEVKQVGVGALGPQSGEVERALGPQSGEVDHPVVVVEEVVDKPPIVPLGEKRLSEEVFMLLTEEPFEGFRSALEDYLIDRVDPRRQHGYVRTVQSWIQMAKPPFKDLMKEDNWRTMVAAALNKLLALPAEEEPKIYSSAKGVVGSVDALRQAIRYEHTQAQKESSYVRGNGRGHGAGSGYVDTTVSRKTLADFDLD